MTTRSKAQGTHIKSQVTEEPCVVKVTSTVLKERVGKRFPTRLKHSQVLQDVVKRVKVTFDRFLKGDSNGKRSGRPRFKARNRYRTFTYPQMKDGCLQGNLINLPMFGKVKVILHRPIPDGMCDSFSRKKQKCLMMTG